MTPQAGLPDARPSRSARRATARSIVLGLGILFTGAALTGIAGAPEERAEPRTGDRALDRSVALIEGAFRSGRPEPLMSLLPGDVKTLVLIRSAGCAAGYYSRDQIYFILSSLFARRETLHFSIRAHKRPRPSGEAGPPEETAAPASCVATWTYRGRDGFDGEAQVHFVLLQRKGAWTLAEIREAQ